MNILHSSSSQNIWDRCEVTVTQKQRKKKKMYLQEVEQKENCKYNAYSDACRQPGGMETYFVVYDQTASTSHQIHF